MKRETLTLGAAAMLLSFAGFACSRTDTDLPAPENDEAIVDRSAQQVMSNGDAENPNGNTPKDQGATPDPQASAESEHTPDPQSATPAIKQIVLAGGCFWCVEAVYEQLEGVFDVESGYAGGSKATANYNAVLTGRTQHAEAVRITYDPSKITYGTILHVFFQTAHDPTTLNRQGVDTGTQYRSAIFFATPEQKKIAEDYIKQLDDGGYFKNPIVTSLEPLVEFFPAETYHQDYAQQNPTDRYILQTSKPKVEKTRDAFPELLRKEGDDE